MDRMVEIQETRTSRGRTTSNGTTEASNVVLGSRDSLTGTLVVEGNVRILGSLEGEVRATGDVDVDSSATVQARIEGRNVNIRGEVTGDVTALARFIVAGSGTVTGNVRAPRLQVDDGATVNGNVTMGPADRQGADSDTSG